MTQYINLTAILPSILERRHDSYNANSVANSTKIYLEVISSIFQLVLIPNILLSNERTIDSGFFLLSGILYRFRRYLAEILHLKKYLETSANFTSFLSLVRKSLQIELFSCFYQENYPLVFFL